MYKKTLLAAYILGASFATQASTNSWMSVQEASNFGSSLDVISDVSCGSSSGSTTMINPFWAITAKHVGGGNAYCYDRTKKEIPEFEHSYYVQENEQYIDFTDSIWGTEGRYYDNEMLDYVLVHFNKPVRGIEKYPVLDSYADYQPKPGDHYIVCGQRWLFKCMTKKLDRLHHDALDFWSHIKASDTPNGNETVTASTKYETSGDHGDSGGGVFRIGDDGTVYYAGWIVYKGMTTGYLGHHAEKIEKLLEEKSFSWNYAVDTADYPFNNTIGADYAAHFWYGGAKNVDFNRTSFESDRIKALFYVEQGAKYQIEFVVENAQNQPAFDITVEGELADIDVTPSLYGDTLRVVVNTFTAPDNELNIEWLYTDGKSRTTNFEDHLKLKFVAVKMINESVTN